MAFAGIIMGALIILAMLLGAIGVFVLGFAVGHASAIQQINEATAVWPLQPKRRSF